MKRNTDNLDVENLPTAIPVFPLDGALLLPGGRLPLNIFEPRYLAMVSDALSSSHRLVGMIQNNASKPNSKTRTTLYPVGCAGRIASFEETRDGRFLIALDGIIRFRIITELEEKSGYRRCQIRYDEFRHDLMTAKPAFNRRDLVAILKRYFKAKGYSADWKVIERCGDEKLITTLAMICPLSVEEKQILLEAQDVSRRGDLLANILKMESEMPATSLERQSHARH